MFTGIITHIGQITEVRPIQQTVDSGIHVRVAVPSDFLHDVQLGDSIAIQGACMTVVRKDLDHFEVDISRESLLRTHGLSALGPVNLEKALRPSDRLGGHFVTGHIDEVGQVLVFQPLAESYLLQIQVSTDLARYMAYKGSVTVNGVSLTINAVDDSVNGCKIAMNLIPHTIQHTTLHTLTAGTAVNIEIDVLARYMDRNLRYTQSVE